MGGARGELSLDTLSLRCLLDTRPRHLGDDGPREPVVQEMGLGWRDRSSLKLSEKQRGPWAEPWSPPRARGQGGGDTRVRPAEGDQEWVVARLPGRSVLGGGHGRHLPYLYRVRQDQGPEQMVTRRALETIKDVTGGPW